MISVQKNISLKSYTSFGIGGPAKFFVTVNSRNEFREALQWSIDRKEPYFILGGGSNLLVSDDGFNGLVIKVELGGITIQDDVLTAEGGVALAKVVGEAAKNELEGLSWAAGIPGSIGGAVRGNAGAFGGSIAESIAEVSVLENNNGKIEEKTLSKEECRFSYRSSLLKENKQLILVSAKFHLKKGDSQKILSEMKETIEKRASKQPQGQRSAGSFFVNPIVENKELLAEFEKESNQSAKDGKIPAGWLVNRVGLSGFQIGDAQVSNKHGNFIINIGNAKAEDVVMLSSLIKQRVRDELGVELISEVELLGF